MPEAINKTKRTRKPKTAAEKLNKQLTAILTSADQVEVPIEAPKVNLLKPEVERGATDIYCVVNRNANKVVETHFKSRADARKLRNYHSSTSKDLFVISRGKDHPLGASF